MVTRKAIYTWNLSWILLLNILHTNVEAGPAKRSGRMAREVYPEIEPENDGVQTQVCIVGDVVYAIDELVPAEQPCLKCRCQPPGVQCETIKCVKKSGCKAIHRPNKCCPDYQCECHHEGKVYANGERLKTPPGGECKVCYCRGGEVQCAEVSCYIRTDCEGKTVPGQCCPKYDHCPPKEPLLGRPTATTVVAARNATTTVNKEVPSSSSTNPLQNSSEQSTTTEPQDANKIESATALENAIKITKATQTDFTDDTIRQIEQPKITIHEIIPEIKEIPMTAPTNQNNDRILTAEDAKDLIAVNEDNGNNDIVVTDPEPDSSEISEVFQQPPPVLRIGDKLLFLKQGELIPEKDASTPTSVITIIGAEGLQRGFEDSAELHEVSIKNYQENSDHALFNNSNDLEPKTSESTHILSLVKKKIPSPTTTTTDKSINDSLTVESSDKKPTTTENSAADSSKTTITKLEVTEATEPTKVLILQINDGDDFDNKTENPSKPDYDTLLEENPAYPEIPEVINTDHIDKHLDAQRSTNMKITPEELEETNTTISVHPTLEPVKENEDKSSLNLKTVETATTDAELNATTTEEITTTNAPIDDVDTTASSAERSVESVEETTEESGENTTPKNDHASIISDENASIEPSGPPNFESMDMLKEASPTSQSQIDDVEMLDRNKTESEERINPLVKDVEMINVDNLTREDVDVKSDKLQLPRKIVDKRESSPQDMTGEIFRELEAELNADSTERVQTVEEEKEESDRVFQELLEETSTPRTIKRGDRNAETLQRVSDTIAGLTLRGRKNSFDSSILGLISNFFGSPSSGFDGKKK